MVEQRKKKFTRTRFLFQERSSEKGFPGGSEVKVSSCNAGDLGSIPGSGRSPGEGNGKPLQSSWLENPMDRGAWWATVHGVAKSQTQLSDLTFIFTCHPYLESVDPTPRDEVTHFITKEGLDPLSISSALLLILCSNRTAIILFSKWRMPGTRTSNNLPMLNSLDSKPKIGFKTQMSWLQILHTTLSYSTTTQHSNVKSNPLKSESPLKSNTIPEESMQEVQFGKWNQSVWIEVYFSLYSQNLFDNFNCMLIHKMIRKWARSWFFNSNFSDKIVWSNEMKSFTLHLTFISWLGGR